MANSVVSMYLAKIFVTLKPSVSDPQGLTILGGLQSLGFNTVSGVRSGKYIEIRLEESSESVASASVDEMCSKLLANPIVENYRFELHKTDKA